MGSGAFPPKLRLDRISLHSYSVELLAPVSGARQIHSTRRVWIVELVSNGISGFGEVSAPEFPNYSHEWSSGSAYLLKRLILPGLMEHGAIDFHSLDWLVGNGSSRFAVESALLDLHAKRANVGITDFLGSMLETDSYRKSRKLYFGVAIGTIGGWSDALGEVDRAAKKSVRRVKFKVDRTRAQEFVSGEFEIDQVEVVLDFNGSLHADELGLLKDLDPMGLSFIEEPSLELGLAGYKELAVSLETRLFLDETTDSRTAIIDMKSGIGVVVKPFRFGSIFLLHNTLELLAKRGMPCYLGGMFESSVGRRFLLAFGSHRCFTDVGDMAPSSWYFSRDIEPDICARAGSDYLTGDFDFGTDLIQLLGHKCTQACFTIE